MPFKSVQRRHLSLWRRTFSLSYSMPCDMTGVHDTAEPIAAVSARTSIDFPFIQRFFSLKILATNSYPSNVLCLARNCCLCHLPTVVTLGRPGWYLCHGWILRCIIGSSLSPGSDTFSSECDHRLRLEDHPIELYVAARNALAMIAFFIVEKTSRGTL
ncbi:hypothetical protein ARMGADRAFT_1036676 [Armillaria gallica]|uniref:Uncharacterized protein n=1 Tax=Armillaria gallica TaxID=47427 RepID=A0A2H3CPL4_ARMGA|nr:hypothetical protein ARMGADRAFT_1036676 [Armillaria gallica]